MTKNETDLKHKSLLSDYSVFQLSVLVSLRFVIGWHFLYEGLIKISNPNWSAEAFLKAAQGPFAGLFQWLALDSSILGIVNIINMWLLTVIGLFLISGIFTRISCYFAVLLLGLYYLAVPAWPGFVNIVTTHGSSLIVDKNIIELVAVLTLIAFPTSYIIGLEGLLAKWRKE